jgi:hypothetical protein
MATELPPVNALLPKLAQIQLGIEFREGDSKVMFGITLVPS